MGRFLEMGVYFRFFHFFRSENGGSEEAEAPVRRGRKNETA